MWVMAAFQSRNGACCINQSSKHFGQALIFFFLIVDFLSKKSWCYGSNGKICNFPNTLLTAWWIQGALPQHSEQESPKTGFKKIHNNLRYSLQFIFSLWTLQRIDHWQIFHGLCLTALPREPTILSSLRTASVSNKSHQAISPPYLQVINSVWRCLNEIRTGSYSCVSINNESINTFLPLHPHKDTHAVTAVLTGAVSCALLLPSSYRERQHDQQPALLYILH